MKQTARKLLQNVPGFDFARRWWWNRYFARQAADWDRCGRPLPPPHGAKQRVLKHYAKKYHLDAFVETGTFMGDMIEAMRDQFASIYSVELSDTLHSKAQARFRDAAHIHLIQGDSGSVLKQIVSELDGPALFWLDGHYSGGFTACGRQETPVLQELAHILGSGEPRHVVIIDDAHCFGHDPAYPNLDQVRQFVRSRNPDLEIEITENSIRIVPCERVQIASRRSMDKPWKT